MKINLKNILYAVAGGLLGIALFIPFSKNIEGAGVASNILTARGGTINLEHFQLSRKVPSDRQDLSDKYPNSVLQPINENAIFRMVGSSIFDNFLSFGQTRFDRLFIGYPNNQEQGAKLSVNGAITIKSLAHDGSTQVKACVNDFGVIEACDGGGTNPPAEEGVTWTCVDGRWRTVLPTASCSPINYASDLFYQDGDSVCVASDTSLISSTNCGTASGGGTGTGTGNDTGTTSGTKYDCAQDGNWHPVLTTCSPAITSIQDFIDTYNARCGNQETRFNNVCFESNPVVDCVGENDPPCSL